MRVMVPYPRTSLGGVETLTCSVIEELTNQVEKVVWVLPDNLSYLKQSVAGSQSLIVETIEWPAGSWQSHASRFVAGLFASGNVERGTAPARLLTKLGLEHRLNHLIRKHRISHSLFTWTLGLPFPDLNVPVVAYVHDRNWRRFPENFPRTTPGTLDKNISEWLGASKAIITPSHMVQEELQQLCPGLPSRIKVVPEAACPVAQNADLPVKNSFGSDRIFYYPGAAGAHKGHLTLFRAAFKLASSGHRFKIVLSGPKTGVLTGDEPAEASQVEQCRSFYHQHREVLQECIENLEFCSPQEVERLYSSALRVVLPSGYEGFGLPLIEAIARGCRVISSDIGPFREQIDLFDCGKFVQLHAVDDFDRLAAYMEEALLEVEPERISPPEVRSMVTRWTWKDATRSILSIMQDTSS